jgi:transposase
MAHWSGWSRRARQLGADLAPCCPDIAAPDDQQARAARANLTLAAPGTLRSAIQNAAQARGVPVSAPRFAATTHHTCGSPLDTSDRIASALVHCQHCDAQVDQDYNTVCHLLDAARSATGAG